VYSFGKNELGELGIGSTDNKNLPQKINFENNEKIIKIFSSNCCIGAFFYSSFIFLLFIFFFNFFILIFIFFIFFFLFFLYLFLFFNFIFFIFFYFFLENKKLFSCGDNDYYQKGIYNDIVALKTPTKIKLFKDFEIENVFTGDSSTFIKTKSSKIKKIKIKFKIKNRK
jgi:alpha-tubulin suppressor-like RCC1 family protein